ncbi:proteasome activator protein PA26 [Angomonas deanei]|uniref:Proteasome activator pa28 beta subunit, putative n=1 Tax=Angomonas deanei TaxID=59799 RepID=A0A7G2C9B6_9TRYP|nr:proteasome activator protein PA26 [Angomonas deanei]CAD2214602.1 Proteasome activator pa28 beta subunit, putative [Angomonas deanei]|eukprot:EPY31428.1 proteasome activator protein PA26 [Angomonas deanei]
MSAPVKRGAMAQKLRDTYTEDLSLAQVHQWSEHSTQELDQFITEVSKARQELGKQPAGAAATPTAVLQLLQRYQQLGKSVFEAVEQIRLVIAIRIPERKEEDNLGVAVQFAVLGSLDTIQNALVKGSSEGKEGGASLPCGVFVAREYLKERGAVEEKVLGDGKEEKKKVPPSALLELQQIDTDYLLRVEMAALHVSVLLKAFINSYALNWKKLIDPRNSSRDRMVA